MLRVRAWRIDGASLFGILMLRARHRRGRLLGRIGRRRGQSYFGGDSVC
jgi:hypothetical protein